MNMKKAILAIAIAFTFVACGSGESTETTTVDSTKVDSTQVDSVKVSAPAVK